ncbi:mitochondrial ribosomal protein S25-domain-containing protein [Fimicolochytrium jonesii]|uniref:mitochondrial ribosomal protein S25-domain-containing protein n=1 Tax=Fimicolochytrium jonesii TaxID=1396493 RepID=UPI0022FEA693|nr:mitochondrial ribosomal protein S25-domain-containing protein [Fimicolochytrium jonesii]KAI8826070.1 mitochondrial ribosomal protein S25-domain-containing protein [Fimicolochytrium jonesii]
MAPPLRNNAYTLCQNVTRLVDAERIKQTPAWYQAVLRFPGAQFTPNGIIPAQQGQFRKPTTTASPSTPFSTTEHNLYKRGNRNYKPKYVTRPPRIVYPEDEIRRAFYRWHPLELRRPRSLVETEETLGVKDWSTIFGDGSFPTGESVVQHTLFLMDQQGLTRHAAYQKALTAFYDARGKIDYHRALERREAEVLAEQQMLAEEEAEEEAKAANLKLADGDGKIQAEAEKMGKDPVKEEMRFWLHKKVTKEFVDAEDLQLQDSSAYEEEMSKAKNAQEEIRNKMAQYEKRNLSDESAPGSA